MSQINLLSFVANILYIVEREDIIKDWEWETDRHGLSAHIWTINCHSSSLPSSSSPRSYCEIITRKSCVEDHNLWKPWNLLVFIEKWWEFSALFLQMMEMMFGVVNIVCVNGMNGFACLLFTWIFLLFSTIRIATRSRATRTNGNEQNKKNNVTSSF